MSQKSLKRKKQGTPRAMPVETIITRFKSAQQKKIHEQNQNNTRSKKVNMRSRKSKRILGTKDNESKSIDSTENSVETQIIQELKETDNNEEYYPDKLRRPLSSKKVVLVPKPSYKLVGGLNNYNKRKLKKPQKEIIHPNKLRRMSSNSFNYESSNKKSELSIRDMIRIDDSDSLDEEDLLEILTCPSPVWWEDPPDGYDEEPLSAKTLDRHNINDIDQQQMDFNKIVIKQNMLNNKNVTQDKVEQTDLISDALHIDVKIKNDDKEFINRRSKLETLLGNIKSKKGSTKESYECRAIKNKDTSINSTTECGRQTISSESCDEDQIYEGNNDEILKTFENIDIPMENKTINNNTKSSPVTENKPIKVLKWDEGIKSPNTKVTPFKGLTIKRCDIKLVNQNKKKVTPGENKESNMSTIEKNKMLFLKGLSVKNGDDIKQGNKNAGLKKSKTSVTKQKQAISPITGLTIKEWDPHMIKRIKKNVVIKKTKNVKENNVTIKDSGDEASKIIQINNKKLDTKSDHVVVYKILNEPEIIKGKKNIENNVLALEVNNEYNIYTQLNSYYNQCKNINKVKKETDSIKNKQLTSDNVSDLCKSKIKSISVSDNETVKYCLQCSSIFDSDICKYCAKNFKMDPHQSGLNKQESFTSNMNGIINPMQCDKL